MAALPARGSIRGGLRADRLFASAWRACECAGMRVGLFMCGWVCAQLCACARAHLCARGCIWSCVRVYVIVNVFARASAIRRLTPAADLRARSRGSGCIVCAGGRPGNEATASARGGAELRSTCRCAQNAADRESLADRKKPGWSYFERKCQFSPISVRAPARTRSLSHGQVRGARAGGA